MNKTELINILNSTQIDPISTLANSYPSAKEIFMSNDSLSIPPHSFDQMDINMIKNNLSILSGININDYELLDWEKNLFEDMFNYNIERNIFVKTNYDYNHSSENDRPEIRKQHDKYNKLIFDTPVLDTFLDILYHTLKQIAVDSLDTAEKDMYEELLGLLPVVPENRAPLFRPTESTFLKLHKKVLSYYEPFLKHIPDQDQYEQIDIYNIACEILEEEFPDKKGTWNIIFESEKSTASVDQFKRMISFPGNRNIPYYTKDSLTKLLIHEMGVHFMRELPYDNIDLEPVRTGLRNYEKYEEGIAVCLSQAAINSFEYSGLIHYISIGLAYFYNKTFRETYEIQKRLQYLADKTPYGRSYDSVQRTFRGTYQLFNFKDLVYFNGTDAIWRHLEKNIDSPSVIEDLITAGKIDIFNECHKKIIKEIRKSFA